MLADFWEHMGVVTVQPSMQKKPDFVRWWRALGLAVVVWLTGCAAHKHSPRLEGQPGPVYDTAEKIQAMPACKAIVVERGPCYLRLRSADGNRFLIGSPAASADVMRFLAVLKDGRTYRLPDTFQKYQDQCQRGIE